MRAYPVPHVQSELKWVCHGVTGIDQHQHQYQHLDGVEAHPPALGDQVIEAVSCTSGFQGICLEFQILLFSGLSGLVAGVGSHPLHWGILQVAVVSVALLCSAVLSSERVLMTSSSLAS